MRRNMRRVAKELTQKIRENGIDKVCINDLSTLKEVEIPKEVDLNSILSNLSETDTALFNSCYQLLQRSLKVKKSTKRKTTDSDSERCSPEPKRSMSRPKLNVVVNDNIQKELFVPAPDTPQNKLHHELLLNLLGKDLATTPLGLQSPGMPFSPSLHDILHIGQLTPHIAQPVPFGSDSKNLLPTPNLGFGPLISANMSPFNPKLSANSHFASPAAPKKFTFDIEDGASFGLDSPLKFHLMSPDSRQFPVMSPDNRKISGVHTNGMPVTPSALCQSKFGPTIKRAATSPPASAVRKRSLSLDMDLVDDSSSTKLGTNSTTLKPEEVMEVLNLPTPDPGS